MADAMKLGDLSSVEREVLIALDRAWSSDEDCLYVRTVVADTGLEEVMVRMALKSLSARDLTEFRRGLFHEDGSVAGSGYRITETGHAMLAASPPAREEAPGEGAGDAIRSWDIEHRLADADGFGASFCRERDGWRLYSMPGSKEFGFLTGYDRPSIDFVMDALRTHLRARTSEPAREAGFLGHLVTPKDGDAVFIPKGERIPLVSRSGTVTPVYDGPQNVTATADKLKVAKEALDRAREDLLRFACARGSEWEGSLEELTEEIDQALATLNEEG